MESKDVHRIFNPFSSVLTFAATRLASVLRFEFAVYRLIGTDTRLSANRELIRFTLQPLHNISTPISFDQLGGIMILSYGFKKRLVLMNRVCEKKKDRAIGTLRRDEEEE